MNPPPKVKITAAEVEAVPLEAKMTPTDTQRMDYGGPASSGWVTIGLLAVVVVVLSRIMGGTGSLAMAEMAISDSGYTMMTTNGGPDEILVLVDSREEAIMVYRASPNTAEGGGLELLERESLSGLFTRARAQAIGGP